MLRKKAFVAVSSRNNQNQVCLSITWFLTGTKAQLRAVTYNELVWPVFMPFPFFFLLPCVSSNCVYSDASNLFLISFVPKGVSRSCNKTVCTLMSGIA